MMLAYKATYLHCEGGLQTEKYFNDIGCERALQTARDKAPLDSWLTELALKTQDGVRLSGKTIWREGKPVWHT